MLNTALFNVLCDNIVETYMSFDNGKDIQGVLKDKFRVSNADNELYVMEQFYDYKTVEQRPIVEQAHEIQSLA
jgi:hypothetical protein